MKVTETALRTAISYLESRGFKVIESPIRRANTLNAGRWKREGYFVRNPQNQSCNLAPMSRASVVALANFERAKRDSHDACVEFLDRQERSAEFIGAFRAKGGCPSA